MKAIVVALALVVACGGGDDVDSYAYIAKVHAYTTRSGTSHQQYHCRITAKLPRALLSAQPADNDTSRLGSDATTVTDDLGNEDDDCDDHLHTWMHVTFSDRRILSDR